MLIEATIEKPKKKTSDPEMRCQGMCKGSCSCPTGYCSCKSMEETKDLEVPPPTAFVREYKLT